VLTIAGRRRRHVHGARLGGSELGRHSSAGGQSREDRIFLQLETPNRVGHPTLVQAVGCYFISKNPTPFEQPKVVVGHCPIPIATKWAARGEEGEAAGRHPMPTRQSPRPTTEATTAGRVTTLRPAITPGAVVATRVAAVVEVEAEAETGTNQPTLARHRLTIRTTLQATTEGEAKAVADEVDRRQDDEEAAGAVVEVGTDTRMKARPIAAIHVPTPRRLLDPTMTRSSHRRRPPLHPTTTTEQVSMPTPNWRREQRATWARP
jgi:hypothetical protein